MKTLQLVEALYTLDPQPTAEELADALWLADWLRTHQGTPYSLGSDTEESAEVPDPDLRPPSAQAEPAEQTVQPTASAPSPEAGLYLAGQAPPAGSFPFRAPAMPAIPRTLRLVRALRPLRATTPSRTHAHLDEAATAQRIAETGVYEPVMRPAPERRYEMALVVDVSSSMVVWRRTVEELRALLEQLGAFRDVRVWYLDTDGHRLALRTGSAFGAGSDRSPDELVDPTCRRVILLVSDCIGAAWQNGRVSVLLDRWGKAGPIAIAQPLPQRLWWRTAVAVEPVRFTTSGPPRANNLLTVVPTRIRLPNGSPRGVPIPVVELTERWLRPWALMISHGGQNVMGAALFTGRLPADAPPPELDTEILSAEERVKRFRASSSPTAFKLATFLAAAPLRLPIMRLVQQAMLPASTSADLAEVFLSGLLHVVAPQAADGEDGAAEGVEGAEGAEGLAYEFHDGVRDVLLGGLRRREILQVLRAVWEVVRVRIGSSLDFAALLAAVRLGEPELPPDLPFARVAAQALARLGGRYREIAEQLTPGGPPGASQAVAEPAALGLRRTHTQPSGTITSMGAGDTGDTGDTGEGVPMPRGGMPARNPDFTGRDALLRAVHTALEHGMAVLLPHAMSGMGGEGKSQLAVEFAYRYADDYDLVWWVPAEQPTSARAALEQLARHLGTPLSDDVKDTVSGVLRALYEGRLCDRWLLIYDNAEAPDEVFPLTPASAGGPNAELAPGRHVLVTTRDRGWERYATPVEIGVFQRPESIQFLRRMVPRLSAAEADLLSERVGDLPLAVQQAAAWHMVTGGMVEDYLRLFDERLAELPEPYRSGDLPRPLATSVGLTLDRLREEKPVTGLLLDLWAVFGPEPVAGRLLAAGYVAALPAELAEVLADEARLRDAMRDIYRYSLARYDAEAGSLQVHRLVRATLDAQLTEDERRKVRGYVHAILAAATPEEEPDVESTWDRRAEITPHVVPSGVFDADGPDIQRVGIDQAKYLYQSGEYEGSRMLAETALSRWRDRYGPDSEAVLEMSRTLANALRGLGDNRAAAEISEDILARMRGKFGDDHGNTLWTALGYGADLRFLGEFRRAHQVDLDAWLRMRRLYGDAGPNALLTASTLGLDLRILGQFQAAFDIDLDVWRRREGPGQPYRQRFQATHNLARDLHALGRYAEAYRLQTESLGNLRPVLGPGHATVLQAKMSHAGTVRKLGRFEAAKALATETLAAHVRRFGAEHPNTLASKVCLALALSAAGEPERGLEHIDEALDGYRRVMDRDHPFFQVCAVNKAVILRRLDEVHTARDQDQTALTALREGILGPNHYYALCAAVGLANDHYLLGEFEAAADLLPEVCERFRRDLGEEHPYALISAYNLERTRAAIGRPGTKADLFLSELERILGPAHPEIRAGAQGRLLECDIEPTAL
jgi:tetratricopeptide (TPR) repeat protein